MKKFIYFVEIFITFISSPLFQFRSIDTRMIDRHIDELNKYSWFNQLYKEEKYRKLFYTNYQTRKYLESPFRVSRLLKSEYAREKFKRFLEKQLEKVRT